MSRIQKVAEQVKLQALQRRGELDPRDELDRIPGRLARGLERLDRVVVGDGEGGEPALKRQRSMNCKKKR